MDETVRGVFYAAKGMVRNLRYEIFKLVSMRCTLGIRKRQDCSFPSYTFLGKSQCTVFLVLYLRSIMHNFQRLFCVRYELLL